MSNAMLKMNSYNSLLEVEAASNELHERDKFSILMSLLSILKKHDLEETIGLRLLHKHSDLKDFEIMVERQSIFEDKFALITQPLLPEYGENCVPNSWQLIESKFVPCEYSERELIRSAKDDLTKSDVFEELSERLIDLGVEHLLGPCLNYSKDISANYFEDKTVLLEITDFENRLNILQVINENQLQPQFTLETKWFYNTDTFQNSQYVASAKCTTVCSVFPNGTGHQGTTYHQRTLSAPIEKEEGDKEEPKKV